MRTLASTRSIEPGLSAEADVLEVAGGCAVEAAGSLLVDLGGGHFVDRGDQAVMIGKLGLGCAILVAVLGIVHEGVLKAADVPVGGVLDVVKGFLLAGVHFGYFHGGSS